MIKQRIDIAFVILHYLVDKQTFKCIDYIQKNIDTDNYKIIIVDNASENGSFESVKVHYGTRDDRIVFIQNKSNLGYAKANNVGINYVMRKYFFDFICCLNNDVYIIEKELYSKLKYCYKQKGFAVLGPLILDGAGQYTSNPQVNGLINSSNDLEEKIKRYKIILNIYKLRMHKIFHLLRWIKNRKNKIRK